jgi:hypothetical protein
VAGSEARADGSKVLVGHDAWFQGPTRSRHLTSNLERLSALRQRNRQTANGHPIESPVAGEALDVVDAASPLAVETLGGRVLRARHENDLTSKELAERLDLSLWMIERLERDEVDAVPFLPAIARATDRPEAWFGEAVSRPEGTPQPANGRMSGPTLSRTEMAPMVVLAALTLLVVIRFFTELVPVLPRAANFIDIPIFMVLLLASLQRPAASLRSRRVAFVLAVGLLFLVMCAISTMTNLSRVDLAPALVFVYGLAGPVGVFYAVHRLWPPGSSKSLSRLLVLLGLLQLVIVFFVNLPQYIADGDPDVISGTFGENPYQLVFFLLVLVGLLSAIFTFEKQRVTARVVPVMLLAIMAAILMAQYRSLLLTTALTVLLLIALLGLSRARGALIGVLAMAALLGTLAYVAQNVPELKFGSAIEETSEDPTLYFEKRLSTAGVLGTMLGDQPRFTITGTGPGTYSSRGWRTFAQTTDSPSDVAGEYVEMLTNGRPYRTDVSDRYVQPQLRSTEIIDGSRAVTSPFSSYLSLTAEVGVIGLTLIVTLYVWAFVSSLRMTLASRGAREGDPLPGLLCASTVAFFVLLQMAVLENWLEVTRITFFSWIVFAVATKEFEARRLQDGAPSCP